MKAPDDNYLRVSITLLLGMCLGLLLNLQWYIAMPIGIPIIMLAHYLDQLDLKSNSRKGGNGKRR